MITAVRGEDRGAAALVSVIAAVALFASVGLVVDYSGSLRARHAPTPRPRKPPARPGSRCPAASPCAATPQHPTLAGPSRRRSSIWPTPASPAA